jgi:hypothetical protein
VHFSRQWTGEKAEKDEIDKIEGVGRAANPVDLQVYHRQDQSAYPTTGDEWNTIEKGYSKFQSQFPDSSTKTHAGSTMDSNGAHWKVQPAGEAAGRWKDFIRWSID